jgi:hypothetical protein
MPPAVIGGTLALGGALIGARGAKSAARTQAEAAEQAAQSQLTLGREQLEATRPLRELALQQAQFQFGQEQQLRPAFTGAALGALPLLREEFETGAGLAPFFQQQLERGTTGAISALAPFGLEESTVAGRAVGELATGLGTQELLSRRNLGLQLAGFAPQTPSFFGGGTAGLASSAALQQAGIQSQLGAGQARAAGQLGAAQAFAQPLALLGGFGLQGGFSGTGQPISLFGAQPSGVQGPVGPGGGFFGR